MPCLVVSFEFHWRQPPETAVLSQWVAAVVGWSVVAEYVTYNFLERVRAPCFGTVETTMSGSKKVGLFLVLGWVYDADVYRTYIGHKLTGLGAR